MNIPVQRKVLEKNDQAAHQNRARFAGLDVTCLNVLGGAGCGKTSLLEAVIPQLAPELRVGVLEGDLATTRDAERIAALHVPVVQILTEGGCHLNATLVQKALDRIPLDQLDLLVIENVGNPICPANFDLGEDARVAVLSVAEGDDKPAKYPLLFKGAALVVLSKYDLLPHVRYDVQRVLTDVQRVNPGVEVLRTDVVTGAGIAQLAAWVRARVQDKRAATRSR